MSKQTAIKRYFLIIKRLQIRKQSFEQLNAFLQTQFEIRGYVYSFSLRTFQREINEIRDVFGIDIQYNKLEKNYFITEEESPEQKQQERLLEVYELLNILETSDIYKDKIFFESRKVKGIEHVFGFLYGIKNRFLIKTEHTNFSDGSEYSKTIKPLALKESQGRWYVLAEDTKDALIKTFALDRIFDLEITKHKFEKQEINFADWFKYSFGIIKPENAIPEKIKLCFTFFQGQYIKSFPLHESQQVIFESCSEDQVVITLLNYITEDFIMELMRYGCGVEVLAPLHLAKKIKEEHKKAFEQY